jgi:hypothetical protein
MEHSCWKGLYMMGVQMKPLEGFFFASSGGELKKESH